MLSSRNGIIEHKFNKIAPAMLEHPGAWSNLTRRSDVFILIGKKQCSKCGEWKEKGEFNKRPDSKDGLFKYCKKCKHAADSQRSKAHPEKGRERMRKWRAANPERSHENDRRWVEANSEKAREKSRRWKLNNPEKAREWYRLHPEKRLESTRKSVKKWTAAHPEKKAEYRRARRARKITNGGNVSAREWEDLKKRYDYTCLCCGRKEPDINLTLDHVKPLSIGGEHSVKNAQPLCRQCNSKKHDKWIDYR